MEKIDWTNSVFVALAVIILYESGKSFLLPKLIKWWNNQSEKGKIRNKIYAQNFENEVRRLINNPDEELIARSKLIPYYIYHSAIILMIFIFSSLGTVLLAIQRYLTYGDLLMFIVLFLISLATIFSLRANAYIIPSVLREVDQRKNRLIKESDFYKPCDGSENKKNLEN